MNSQRIPRLAAPVARKRHSGKIIAILVLLLLTLLAVLFFRSDLSKIDTIEVTGYRYTTIGEIEQAIHVKQGDSFFADTSGSVRSRLEQLPAVESAIVRKHFPGVIRVEISEYQDVAYLLQADGRMFALLSSGFATEPIAGEPAKYLPILSNWDSGSPMLDKLCKVLQSIPGPVLADISQIKSDPSDSYADRVRIYTRSKFEVVTSIEYLPNKLDYMRAIIGENEPGVITMLEANTYKPYD